MAICNIKEGLMKKFYIISLIIILFISCKQENKKQLTDHIDEVVSPHDEKIIEMTDNIIDAVDNDYQYIPPSIGETVEFIENYDTDQLEIYAVSDAEKRMLAALSFYDYNEMLKIELTRNYLFCLNWEHTELMCFDLKTGIFSSTNIPCERSFSLSEDEKFACVSVENENLKGFLTTHLPCLVDFESKEIIKEYYFDFLEDEIGIDLSIDYDESTNSMKIRYNWDTPIPQFEGYISLDDENYEFIRTK